jgi:hypothetical protein
MGYPTAKGWWNTVALCACQADSAHSFDDEEAADGQDGGLADEDGYELVGDVPMANPVYEAPFLALGGMHVSRRITQGNPLRLCSFEWSVDEYRSRQL